MIRIYPPVFVAYVGSKLGDQSVRLTPSSLFQTNASVWTSRCEFGLQRFGWSCSQQSHLFSLQVLKLQESPDMVPKGEMPRHMQLYCDRYLTNRVVPGNRITVMGIYSIRKSGMKPAKVRQPCNRIIMTVGVAQGQRASSLPWCCVHVCFCRTRVTRPAVQGSGGHTFVW